MITKRGCIVLSAMLLAFVAFILVGVGRVTEYESWLRTIGRIGFSLAFVCISLVILTAPESSFPGPGTYRYVPPIWVRLGALAFLLVNLSGLYHIVVDELLPLLR